MVRDVEIREMAFVHLLGRMSSCWFKDKEERKLRNFDLGFTEFRLTMAASLISLNNKTTSASPSYFFYKFLALLIKYEIL